MVQTNLVLNIAKSNSTSHMETGKVFCQLQFEKLQQLSAHSNETESRNWQSVHEGVRGFPLPLCSCQKQWSKYACPRCNVRYCSLPCYKVSLLGLHVPELDFIWFCSYCCPHPSFSVTYNKIKDRLYLLNKHGGSCVMQRIQIHLKEESEIVDSKRQRRAARTRDAGRSFCT